MAIVIKPNNIFDKSGSKLNNNVINTTAYNFYDTSKKFETAYSDNPVFRVLEEYEEQQVINYRYVPTDYYWDNPRFASGDKTILADLKTFNITSGEIDIETLMDYEQNTSVNYIKYASDASIAMMNATVDAIYYNPNTDSTYTVSYDLGKSNIRYYDSTIPYTRDVYFTMLTGSKCVDIVILPEDSDNKVITFWVLFEVDQANDDKLISANVDFKIELIENIQRQSEARADFVMSTNELCQEGTELEAEVEVTNNISVNHYTYSSPEYHIEVWAESQSAVASNISVRIIVKYSKRQEVVDVTIQSGETTSAHSSVSIGAKDYIIASITPSYDASYVYSIPKINICEHLSNKIISNYSNGKETCKILCSIDDYYDEEGNKMLSKYGDDGLPIIFKNNDIVLPKRVKMIATIVDGNTEMDQREVDFDNKDITAQYHGKKFRVVSVKIAYDGCIMQELTLQEEKTQ